MPPKALGQCLAGRPPSAVHWRSVRAQPQRPQLLLHFAGGLLAALAAGIAVAFAAEYFDRTIKTADDVEQLLELNSVANVPQLGRGAIRVGPITQKHAHIRPR